MDVRSTWPGAASVNGALARPLVVTCGPLRDELLQSLADRPVDVMSSATRAEAMSWARFLHPVVCVISGTLEGGDPAAVIAEVVSMPSPPVCVVVLDIVTWRHADACRRAGADHVVHADDPRALTRALRYRLPALFTRARRAEVKLPLELSVGDRSFTAASLDLRETGVAILDAPALPLGAPVRLRLAIDETEVWLDGEVARAFVRGAARVVAVRFVDVTPEVSAWIGRLIARLQQDGPEALALGAWRADVRTMVGAVFVTPGASPALAQLGAGPTVPPRATSQAPRSLAPPARAPSGSLGGRSLQVDAAEGSFAQAALEREPLPRLAEARRRSKVCT